MNVKAILLLGSIGAGVFGGPAEAEARCKRNRCCQDQYCAPTCCAPACAAAPTMDTNSVQRELIQLRFDHDRLRADFDALKTQVNQKSK